MDCPNCKINCISFNKIYQWPFGIKTCSECNVKYKVKKNNKLAFASVCLGFIALIPPFALNNYWYVIPSTVFVLLIDYLMDKRFRVLQKI